MANAKKWLRIIDQLPPENKEVETKIDDDFGCRDEHTLFLTGKDWVYANTRLIAPKPTHWRYKK